MSLPTFPAKDSMPTRDEVINQIISSIAMEELGLSHIINAEGEKLQYALGTIPGVIGPEEPLTMEGLLELNNSIHKTLDSTMMNQFLLKEKLISALTASVMQGPTGPTGPHGPATIKVKNAVDKLNPGDDPYVYNDGSDVNVELRFGIPKGDTGPLGPAGPEGPTGPTGPDGLSITFKVGKVLPVTYSETFVRDTGTGNNVVLDFGIPVGPIGPEGDKGPKGDTGPIGPAASSHSIIPFSGINQMLKTVALGDEAVEVAPLGLGSFSSLYPILINDNGTINLSVIYPLYFIVPYDAVIKRMYLASSISEWNYGEGTCHPYIELYSAPLDSGYTFTPVAGSVVNTTGGLTNLDPLGKTVFGSSTDLDIRLSAGTRLLIAGKARTKDIVEYITVYLNFHGGIEFRPDY